MSAPAPKGDDLADFAKTYHARPGPGRCWGCLIPEADLIAKHYRAGMQPAVILAWLIQRRGYKPAVATSGKLRDHLRKHVAAPPGSRGQEK